MHSLGYRDNVTLFLFSDGFQDQFGGRGEVVRPMKIGRQRMRDLLFGNAHLPMEEQSSIYKGYFHEWKGEEKQIDDVLLMGMKFGPPKQ